MQKQLTNLKEYVTEVESASRTVEALKIEAKVNDGDVSEWNDAITAKLEEADSHTLKDGWWIEKRKQKNKIEKRKIMQFEIKPHETELKLHDNL